MPPAITAKQQSITTADSTKKPRTTLTRREATPSTPEITLKTLGRLTPRNTERNNIPRKPRHLGGVFVLLIE